MLESEATFGAADRNAAEEIAALIANHPPSWLAPTIAEIALPDVRRDIKGQADFPNRLERLDSLKSIKQAADRLMQAMLDPLDRNVIAHYWRAQNTIAVVGEYCPDHHASDDDVRRQLQVADLAQRQRLLDDLAHLSNTLQRAIDHLPLRGQRPHPDTPPPQVICAIWIAITWDAMRGKLRPYATALREPCAKLWKAAGGAGALTKPAAGWRAHLVAAEGMRESPLFCKRLARFEQGRDRFGGCAGA